MKPNYNRDPVERRVMRPSNGWKYLSGAVWEHTNGTRIHLSGMMRLPNGDWLSANTWPESRDADRMIRINGGNRRRGLMAWAMTHNQVMGSTRGYAEYLAGYELAEDKAEYNASFWFRFFSGASQKEATQ